MGWTYTHKPYREKVMDFFKREFSGEFCEVIDGSVVKFRTAYLACKNKKTNEVFALVCLLNFNRHEYHNFGYKEIEETCGPYQFDCPKRILNLLTTPMNETANVWRKRCLGESVTYPSGY